LCLGYVSLIVGTLLLHHLLLLLLHLLSLYTIFIVMSVMVISLTVTLRPTSVRVQCQYVSTLWSTNIMVEPDILSLVVW
jgi:hypothetical protein